MLTHDELREALLNRYSELGTWPKVAEYYGVDDAMVWRVAKTDYLPKDAEIRKKLGLPSISTVIPVSGVIVDGSYSVASKICIKCGKPFIPNSPKREKCQICVPPRKRKK